VAEWQWQWQWQWQSVSGIGIWQWRTVAATVAAAEWQCQSISPSERTPRKRGENVLKKQCRKNSAEKIAPILCLALRKYRGKIAQLSRKIAQKNCAEKKKKKWRLQILK
jgi:hypothetical protein